jgi:glycosyltransferase involved in cell wall biosynthesis
VSATYYPCANGGAEISTQVLAEALAKRGIEVVVVTGGDADVDERINGVMVRRMRIRNVYWSFHAAKQTKVKKLIWHALDSFNEFMASPFKRILDDEHPTLVLTNRVEDFSPIVWRVAKRAGYRVLHTIRDFGLMCAYATMHRAGRNCVQQCGVCRLLTTPKRLLSTHVDHVVGISNAVLERHLAAGYFPRSTSNVIVNIYEPKPGQVQSVQREAVLRFGYLGRLHPTKGLDRLIDEYRLANVSATTRLLVAGTGTPDYEESLKRRAAGLDIELLGRQEPSDFFSRIDVLIVPSLWEEPLGRVIFEAYAHSTPVIASRRGGIPEIVRANETGFLFEPDERGGLARLLSLISADRTKIDRLRPLCFREARRFSAEEVTAQYLKLFLQPNEPRDALPATAVELPVSTTGNGPGQS